MPRETGGGNVPQREDWFEASGLQLALAVGSDVAQEEISEGHGVDLLGFGAVAHCGHFRLVDFVGAGPGELHWPQRQTDQFGLLLY